MKKLRIGINGFGRIGRALVRINQRHRLFDIALINDINPDTGNMAYLLKYDSVYGNFPVQVDVQNQAIVADGQTVPVCHHADILEVPWHRHDVDVLIDSSGISSNASLLESCADCPEYTISTHAVGENDKVRTVVFGVNEEDFSGSRYKHISSSICDTVAMGPLIKILNDRHGIESGFLTTLHPWLSYQHLEDGNAVLTPAYDHMQSGYALGRSAVNNLIPKSTTAVLAADVLFPGLSKKISAFSYRVPTNIVSTAVLNLELTDATTKEQLTNLLCSFEQRQQWKILSNSVEPKVSIDYRGCEYSVVLDQRWTVVQNGKSIRLVYWYDNEWGYSSRVFDIVRKIDADRTTDHA